MIEISLDYVSLQLISVKDMLIPAQRPVFVSMMTRLMDIYVVVLRDLLVPNARNRVRIPATQFSIRAFDEIIQLKLYILFDHVYLTFLIKRPAFDCDSVLSPSSDNLNASLTYNGQCYVFYRERLDWLHAREKCKQLNGSFDLLSILNEEENSFVIEYMKLMSEKRAWT